MNILFVYGTSRGYTAKVAARIAEDLRGQDNEVELVDAETTHPDHPVPYYDEVIIAASMNSGRFQPTVVEFLKANRDALGRKPTIFLPVSLSVAYDSEKNLQKYRGQLDAFFDETGWRPDMMIDVAGAIPRSMGTGLMRLIWRILVGKRKAGIPTGRTNDPKFAYEFTDWDAIGQFMRRAIVQPAQGVERQSVAECDS